MYNYSILRGMIITRYRSQGAFARSLGIPEQKVSATLNNRRQLDQTEIDQWAHALDIPHNRYGDIFFDQVVHDGEQYTSDAPVEV